MFALNRRTALVLAGLAGVLVVSRWMAALAVERWWRSALITDLATFGTWWHLLGTTLDAVAIAIGFSWLLLHFLHAVTRAGPGDPSGEMGPSRLGTIPRPVLRRVTILLAFLLAVLTGAGFSRWTDEVVLVWQGVPFGIRDPSFGRDIGDWVAAIPLWNHIHDTIVSLVLLATVGSLVAYGLGGALAIRRGHLLVSSSARRHLGLLGATVAACIAWGYLLVPAEVAGGFPQVVSPAQVRLHETTALVLAGAAGAVAALTLAWGFRATHMTAVASWLVLLAAMVIVRFLAPPNFPSGGSGDATWLDARWRIERAAYGVDTRVLGDTLRPWPGSVPASTPPGALWDRDQVMRSLPAADSHRVEWANRGRTTADVPSPAWWVLVNRGNGTRFDVRQIPDDQVARDGTPVLPAVAAGDQPLLGPGTIRPGAPAHAILPDSAAGRGVPAGSWPRRLLLAWVLQEGGIVSADPGARVIWHLDPVDRLRTVAPFADWVRPELVLLEGKPVWLVDGVVTAPILPASRRLLWRGEVVAFARAEFLAVIGAEEGSVRIYLRPDAGPIGFAWAAVAAPMISPTSDIPSELERIARYPGGVLELQAHLFGSPLAGAEIGGLGIGTADHTLLRGVLLPPGAGLGEQGGPRYHPVDSVMRGLTPESLEPRWNRNPLLRQMRDSVLASGGRALRGGLRYQVSGNTLLAYQPWYAVPSDGPPVLLAVSAASGARIGVERTLESALEVLAGQRDPALPTGPDSTLLEARVWLHLADSALRRGDLAAFGSAFTALRDLLLR